MINVVIFLLDSTVDIFSDEGNTFTGILFQDSVMKSLFASYPKVLMSEIVAVFLTSVETSVAISKMVKAFKAHNFNWIATTAVVSDKDFTERTVFQQEFPNASLVICLFHVLCIFVYNVYFM